ncbi:M24 family metallopeptidase [Thermodesulfobacteriota bacterium]
MQEPSIHFERITKLREILKSKGVSSFLTTKRENFFYLTGFTGSAGVFYTDLEESYLFTDSRYLIQSKNEVSGSEVIIYKKGAEVYERLKKMKQKEIGFNPANISFNLYNTILESLPKVKLKGVGGVVEGLRMIKDEHELKILKEAITIAEKSLVETLASLEVGDTEISIKNRLECAMRNNGGEKESFDTIVVSGENSALIHGRPSNKSIKEGELILIDFGVKHKNYCSDKTHTVMLGEPTKEQRKVYDIVKKANEIAIAEIKDGVSIKHIDSIARDYIKKSGYGDYFLHGLGHGIGLEVHEMPLISSLNKTILKEGMVITVEPGIYMENFGGIRLEDMIYITNTGAKKLTTASSRLELK